MVGTDSGWWVLFWDLSTALGSNTAFMRWTLSEQDKILPTTNFIAPATTSYYHFRKQTQNYKSTMADQASYMARAVLALFAVYSSFTATAGAYILFWMLYFPKLEQPKEPQNVQEVMAMLTSRTLEIASLLQHVQPAPGEKCALCHDDEPVAPVRISCQHLFCCGCAHAVFTRQASCPLCFRIPLPQQKTAPVQEFQPIGLDVRGRLAMMYTIALAYAIFCGIPAALVLYLPDCKSVLRDLFLFQCLVVVLLFLWLIILLVINRSRYLTARFARRD
jgi:hypothetical protein